MAMNKLITSICGVTALAGDVILSRALAPLFR
jgi:hypothetical protein